MQNQSGNFEEFWWEGGLLLRALCSLFCIGFALLHHSVSQCLVFDVRQPTQEAAEVCRRYVKSQLTLEDPSPLQPHDVEVTRWIRATGRSTAGLCVSGNVCKQEELVAM